MFWAGGLAPPNVYYAKKVNVIGRLVTQNDGQRWIVQDALAFEGSFRKIMNPVMKYLYQFSLDPRTYSTEDRLDIINIKDYD
ncbi:MAG TPA: hypothetical protein VKP13_09615 [Nitrospira sp.]|nr:hypothetical protein [Nitrospira sp.]